jgi:glucokinase
MESPVVLGIDFGGTKIAAAVAEIGGTRLGGTTLHTVAGDSAPDTFHRAITSAHELLDQVAPGRTLLAVGACTFGIPHDDRIELAPTIDGWGELAFGRELRAAFPQAEIRMATDVKAAAQAEAQWGALLGCDPGVYVNLGTGLAVAIVVDGVVLAGRHGAAGEIGYNLRERGLEADGRLVLEDAVSGKALTESARHLRSDTSAAIDVCAAAGHDPRAAALLDDFIAELSFHLVNLTIAIDPARIVVGGGMVRSWDQLVGPLRAALDAAVPFPPELVRADYPFDAPLMGALALAGRAAHDVLCEGASA